MQVFATVLSGTLVFVLGQIILKLLIEPWQRQRESIALVASALTFYAPEYGNPGVGTAEAQDEAARELRRCAADLNASASRIPFHDFWARIMKSPSRDDLFVAERHLFGLSNTVHSGSTDSLPGRLRVITQRLRIELRE
jgi:hypothetical protein